MNFKILNFTIGVFIVLSGIVFFWYQLKQSQRGYADHSQSDKIREYFEKWLKDEN